MKQKATYLLSGPGFFNYLIVSLYTLRKHYSGPIQVLAYEESHAIARRIAEDPRLDIEVPEKSFPVEYRKKNSQFIHKIKACRTDDCDVRVYLDADTSFRGPIDELFSLGLQYGMAITQFNQWTTQGGIVRQRVERLLDIPEIPKEIVLKTLKHSYPSPNGGIFAVTPSSPVLPVWEKFSWAAKDIFICDEAVLHILPQLFPPSVLMVETSGRYNCSHKWINQVQDPVIMHYHGNSATRPDKSRLGVEEFWPLYGECLELNLGFVNEWKSSVSHKWMQALRKQKDFSYAHLVP